MFVDLNDNPKHVYTTSWLINGKPRFVAVDDWVPGSGASITFAHLGAAHAYWPMILEKAYAKIHGNYAALIEGNVNSKYL